MIEKRLVQWYAADEGVDLDIAEREISLTYVLRVMADSGILDHLAFKGGTAIRKLHLGNQGRFSLDLDFIATEGIDPESLILEFVSTFHEHSYFGLNFSIQSPDYYATADSCGAEVSYQHEWVAEGKFGIQISFRAKPILPIHTVPLLQERYFNWLGVEPPEVPALDLHEILGEKIRAAAQRNRVRDIYDLYQFANKNFNRDITRSITVLKCWETFFAFDPNIFLNGLLSGNYDWADLHRLVKRGWYMKPETIIQSVQDSYLFLVNMTEAETILASDPYNRQRAVYRELVDLLRKSPRNP
jgi:predicted nucleotidyltransferase component of viral defense system